MVCHRGGIECLVNICFNIESWITLYGDFTSMYFNYAIHRMCYGYVWGLSTQSRFIDLDMTHPLYLAHAHPDFLIYSADTVGCCHFNACAFSLYISKLYHSHKFIAASMYNNLFTFLATAHTLVGLHDMRDTVADMCAVVEDAWAGVVHVFF